MVEYSADDQIRAAVEVEALPKPVAIVRMLSDYSVLRDQARACRRSLGQKNDQRVSSGT